jgi:hypothetical protein
MVAKKAMHRMPNGKMMAGAKHGSKKPVKKNGAKPKTGMY